MKVAVRRLKHFSFTQCILALAVFFASVAEAATGLTYHGRILKPDTTPLTSSNVLFHIQIKSPGAEDCLLYDESHTLDLSATSGLFVLKIGSGTRVAAGVDGGNSLERIFANRGTLTLPTCASGTTYSPSAADIRYLYVSFSDNGGPTQTLAVQSINSAPFAVEAKQVGGYGTGQLLRVADGTTATEFSNANWNALWDLITGASSVYLKADGSGFTPTASVDFNNQKIVDLADPTLAQDAATKNYSDTKVGGKTVDVTGVSAVAGNGSTLIWDQVGNRWTTGAVADASKLPLAGGTMSGSINLGTFSLSNAGHVGIADQGTLYLGKFTTAQETTLLATPLNATTDRGRTWFNVTTGKMRIWNGSAVSDVGADLGYTPVNKAGDTMSGLLVLSADPSAALGAATKQYVDAVATASSSAYFRKDGTSTMSGNIQLNSNWISNDGGNEGIHIENDGDVGIGTATPGSKLHVAGRVSGEGGFITAGVITNVYSPTSAALSWPLQGANYGAAFSATNSSIGDGKGAFVHLQARNTAGNQQSSYIGSIASTGAGVYSPTIVFGQQVTDTTSYTERMRIDASGNVGIGTINPGYKLDVAGDINVTGNFKMNGVNLLNGGGDFMKDGSVEMTGAIKAIGGSVAAPGISFSGDPDTGIVGTGSNGIQLSTGGAMRMQILNSDIVSMVPVYIPVGSAASPSLTFIADPNTGISAPTADNLVLSTNGSERMRINSTGNIGIGTATPVEKLDVSGAIKIGNSVAATAGTMRWNGTNFQAHNGTAWQNLIVDLPASGACDTTQSYTSAGTHAYTVPASFGTITIRAWGGGGGGGAGVAIPASTNGQTSSISSLGLSAGGGVAGFPGGSTGAGGAAGTGSGGTVNTAGAAGSSAGGGGSTGPSGSGGTAPSGGTGGTGCVTGTSSCVGAAGGSPGGGGGGGRNSAATSYGGGGGSGGYVEKTFTTATLTPGTTINDLIVGAGGVGGGTSSSSYGPGGDGGVGQITVTCSSTGAPPVNNRGIVFLDSGALSSDANFVFDSSGRVGIGIAAPTVSLDLSAKTDAINLPRGTTAQRPASPVNGMARYNTTSSKIEFYENGQWVSYLSTINAQAPPGTGGTGYFVLTEGVYNGNLGGLAGANSICRTELSTKNWMSKPGGLDTNKVFAFLCNSGGCQNPQSIASYFFAVAGDATVGGAGFSTNGSGAWADGDSFSLTSPDRFSAYGGSYWLGPRGWANLPGVYNPNVGGSTADCTDWTTDSAAAAATVGSGSANDQGRFLGASGGTVHCAQTRKLICFVNP